MVLCGFLEGVRIAKPQVRLKFLVFFLEFSDLAYFLVWFDVGRPLGTRVLSDGRTLFFVIVGSWLLVMLFVGG